jgi:hypothetical protein
MSVDGIWRHGPARDAIVGKPSGRDVEHPAWDLRPEQGTLGWKVCSQASAQVNDRLSVGLVDRI